MKKLLFASACLMAISGSSAMAQNSGAGDRATTGQAGSYAYCLQTGPGPGDCKYTTMQQCQAAMSGTAGNCVRNVGPR